MGRTRAKRSPSAEASNKRDSWVACTSCDVWIDIEDTPFESVEEASATAHYDCKQCVRLNVLREEFAQLMRQHKEECMLQLENTETRLNDALSQLGRETRMREELQARVSQLQTQLDDLKSATEGSQTEKPEGSPHAATDNNGTSRLPQKEEKEPRAQDKVPNQAAPGSRSGSLEPREEERSQLDDECALEVQGWRPTLGNKKRKKLGKSSRETGSFNKEEPKQERFGEPLNKSRCAFIYGDRNAFRMRYTTLRTVKWNRLVQFRTWKDATLQKVMAEMDAAVDIWSAPEAVVVVHCGSSDIVDNDTSPDIPIQELKSRMQTWQERANKHRFIVYGVPEPEHCNDVMQKKCKLWNEKLRKICDELGQQVEFVSTTRAPTGGVHSLLYKVGAAEELGTRLGHRLCVFLGLQPVGPTVRRTRTSRYSHPLAPLMTALGQAMLQIAGNQDQVKRRKPPRLSSQE
ncbi:hypothetical protein HPB52_011501 [Rhipicephalus sanguineus]|uniref:Uncharacterized protein n=1 Tax=Rhipicephalus sanguineus TaxID=34632 RepID=A0A9D4T9K7_RHISA|nr:hypothetical protein HPB52_011501 [Rhipicephalus sanguineus]